MTQPFSSIYNYIVRELAPTEHELDEAPVSVVCEPISIPGGTNICGTISMRLKAGTSAEEAQAIANTLQTKVKGLCHHEAMSAEAR